MAIFLCATCLLVWGLFWLLFPCLCSTQNPALVEEFFPRRENRYSEDDGIPLPLGAALLWGSCSRVRSDNYVLGNSCCSQCCGLSREVCVITETDLNLLSLGPVLEILRVCALELLNVTCWISGGIQWNNEYWMPLKVGLCYTLNWESQLKRFFGNLNSPAFPLRSF